MTDALPADVRLLDLQMNADDRGSVTEVLRQTSLDGREIVQINVSIADANVLRGVHLHLEQWDYIVVASGEMFVALIDLRRGSPSFLRVTTLTLDSRVLQALIIPPGVGHGFYTRDGDVYLNAMNVYWRDGVDQFRLRYDDAEAGIPWPADDPVLSAKDLASPSLADLLPTIPAYDQLRPHR